MDDEASVKLPSDDGGDDFVERDGDGLDLWSEELEREIGGGERAGDGDAQLLHLVERELLRSDDHGAVAVADGATAGHQGVVFLDVGVGVEADGGDVIKRSVMARWFSASMSVSVWVNL